MKRTLYLITMIALVLVSCDPMEEINNELKEMDTGYKDTFTYVLTSDDYTDIEALALAKDPNDTKNAAFISSNEYFNDEVPAANYIPLLIPEIYPALGLESSGLISYNYNGSVPEDLTIYTTAPAYKLAEGEYTSPDLFLNSMGSKYFSPSHPPEVYIPGILEAGTVSPASGDLLLVEYMYSDVDPLLFEDGSTLGKAPEKYKDFYVFSGGAWKKAEGVCNVNAVDYNAMGIPGKYDNFSASEKPADYIPNLLKNKFPLAGQDEEVIVVYIYYAGKTLTLASTYTYNNGGWESSYDYVVTRTDQFIRGGSGWVFDPTVTFTMTPADFQIIVDHVASGANSSYVDSYGTGESYYGAGAYYVNFDIRPTNYAKDVFGTWEKAVEEALGKVLLPAKFPNATTQMNGVDMFYVVNFATYSGADGIYSMKFQVTKAGPDPEFTLVEGPV